jgi:predicted molibdopterin-dependent oxidoreductase YjgC
VNVVTSAGRDAVTKTPEYKVTAVRIERLVGEAGGCRAAEFSAEQRGR